MSQSLLTKLQAPAPATARGNGLYDFTLSTSSVDRDGDTIDPRGWRLDAYKENPVVLWGHRHDLPAIGRAVDIGVRGDRLVATMEFPPNGVYQLADEVRGLVDAGFLTMTSVGFKPTRATPNHTRGGVDYHEQTLLEFSIVNVPSNTDARLMTPTVRDADRLAITKWLNGDDPITVLADDAVDALSRLPDLTTIEHEQARRLWEGMTDAQIDAYLERSVSRQVRERWEREGLRISAMHSPRPEKSRIGCPRGSACPMDTPGPDPICPVASLGQCPYPGMPEKARAREDAAHIHYVTDEAGLVHEYDDRRINFRTLPRAVQKALIAEIWAEHGESILSELADAALPDIRQAYTRLTGRLD